MLTLKYLQSFTTSQINLRKKQITCSSFPIQLSSLKAASEMCLLFEFFHTFVSSYILFHHCDNMKLWPFNIISQT